MNAGLAPPPREIDHNRRGLLAPEQAAFIAKYRLLILLVYAIPLAMLGLAAASFFFRIAFEGHHDLVVRVLAAGAGLAVLAAMVAGGIVFWRRMGGAAQQNVTCIDGRVVWAGPPAMGVSRTGWAPAGLDGVPFALKQPVPVLPPGPYRFYLHNGYLVAAESPLDTSRSYSITQNASSMSFTTAAATSPRPPPLPVGDPGALVAGLAATMGFTWEDLQYHRQGMLSPRQGVGRVFVVEGPLSFTWTGNPRVSVTYWWEVGGRQFPIPLDWMWLAPMGVVYRCYVDAQSQRLLSMEPAGVPPDR
jgi:hypothetical protein